MYSFKQRNKELKKENNESLSRSATLPLEDR
jgi:hypothetical protein